MHPAGGTIAGMESPLPAPDPGVDADPRITAAAALLAQGRLVGLPTETVYGLAADARNPDAVRAIFALKQRPADHPLIVHIGSVEELHDWAAEVPPAALALARAFWPGPLTLVLPARADVPREVTGGLDTVALRMPAHPLALALLRRLGRGLAAPSANRHLHVSPTTAEHVRAEFGDALPLVLDGGPCTVGIESTIVDVSTDTPRILRPGRISAAEIADCLQKDVDLRPAAGTRSPGLMKRHYSPRAQVLCAPTASLQPQVEACLARGLRTVLLAATPPAQAHPRLDWLDAGQAPALRMQRLYALLREADARGADVIVAELPDGDGPAEALRDRLLRAAGQGSVPTH
jgi:L-threonylcarbamoyladenylate synthase